MEILQTDLLVIGGGINGTGIAADAAGRGLSVVLCEKDDLASGTSSWSSKLIHGGLRYLEQYDFRLVRRALQEREILLQKAPHIIHPLKFVLPHDKHLRPTWMIRSGLFLYDHLAKRKTIPGSTQIKLRECSEGNALKPEYTTGFSYYDCATDDARLCVLNAIAAKNNNARILTRTECLHAERQTHHWTATLQQQSSKQTFTVQAKAIVNATGPWADRVAKEVLGSTCNHTLVLVKGSHIVLPKLYTGKHAYILQNPDNRVIFAIPYQRDFTLIGTTDEPFTGNPSEAKISASEIQYLCDSINQYFKKPIAESDIVWSYSGVRPLYGSTSKSLSKISREFHLVLDEATPAPLLSVLGGKLTTFRVLAEQALNLLKKTFPNSKPAWTAHAKLPGSDFSEANFGFFYSALQRRYPWLPQKTLQRYAHTYGTLALQFLKNATSLNDLGKCLGADLYEKEVQYLVQYEWAQTWEDILWRRTKLGLHFSASEIEKLKNDYLVL